jgi:3-deoxy-D-manno-octulosonate 8-phosphate phosphatase KdsC-like HAD superfamily phosphatase
LDTGVLAAVVSAGDDNVAVKLADDLDAIFFDGSLGADLHGAVLKSFNKIDGSDFFQHDFSLFPA